jgi:hypothetical protein
MPHAIHDASGPGDCRDLGKSRRANIFSISEIVVMMRFSNEQLAGALGQIAKSFSQTELAWQGACAVHSRQIADSGRNCISSMMLSSGSERNAMRYASGPRAPDAAARRSWLPDVRALRRCRRRLGRSAGSRWHRRVDPLVVCRW